MRRIVPHPVWIGHAGDGREYTRLYEAGIRSLVHLAVEEPALQVPRDLIYLRVPLADATENRGDSLTLAIRSVSQLLSARVPTLVFCAAGMSRSSCVVAAALAVNSGEPPEDRLRFVISHGPCDISPGLWNEVTDLLRCWEHRVATHAGGL
ncbi:dual specificity protein phosphatase [Isosphaeraceae bacterium EP7]